MSRSVILIVDDEPVITETLALILNRFEGEFLAVGCTSVADALTIVHGIHPDLVVLDAMMPGAQGLEHALEMREQCGCKVLLISGQPATSGFLEDLLRAGDAPFEIMAKPIHPMELVAKIREMLKGSVRASKQGSSEFSR